MQYRVLLDSVILEVVFKSDLRLKSRYRALWVGKHTTQFDYNCNKNTRKTYLLYWNRNVVILTKLSSLAAMEVVKLTTSSATNDENSIKMIFPFQCNWLNEWLSLMAFLETVDIEVQIIHISPCNHNLHIGIIIFPRIDNAWSTGYN